MKYCLYIFNYKNPNILIETLMTDIQFTCVIRYVNIDNSYCLLCNLLMDVDYLDG